jgi:hypothetical protein
MLRLAIAVTRSLFFIFAVPEVFARKTPLKKAPVVSEDDMVTEVGTWCNTNVCVVSLNPSALNRRVILPPDPLAIPILNLAMPLVSVETVVVPLRTAVPLVTATVTPMPD